MSEGLDKLKTIRHIHDMECGEDERINKDFDIIKQELEEKETQDDYIKMLEDRINNLETSYLRNKKALEILISLFDIKIVGGYLIARRGETCIVYNLILKQNQEIINSLKEVLDYD